MAKGDGSITEVKRSNGKSFDPKHWRICLSLGTDPISKKRIKVQTVFEGTKMEARKERDRLKAEHESGLSVAGEKMTFAEFASQWHEAREIAAEVGLTRLKREKSMMDELCKYLGTARLRDITPQTVESLFTQMRKDKAAAGKKISSTTLNMYHKLLKQILGKAVDYDLILKNPVAKVKAPKCATAQRRSLSAEEAHDLIDAIDKTEAEAYEELAAKQRRSNNEPSRLQGMSRVSKVIAARIGLATGMRRGEVIGLTWGCVDFEHSRIRVMQSVTVLNETKPPKSEAGKRLITVDSNTMFHLKVWKARQAIELDKICIEQGDATPVCCSDTGDIINPNNFSRWWREFAEDNGFTGLKYHELRHTQASQLIASGMDVKTVQHRLGHASATLTMNLYAHALPENDDRAAECIGKLLSSKPEASEISTRKTA